MDFTTAIVVVSSATAILGYLGFAPNGPHLIAKARARLEAPRKRQEALEQKVDKLDTLLQSMLIIDGHESRLRDATIEDVRELKQQANAFLIQLREMRDQITDLRTQDMNMLASIADILGEFRLADTQLREAIDELNRKVAALQQQLDKEAADGLTLDDALLNRLEALEHEVQENLGVIGEAVRIAEDPTGAHVEQLAKNYAKGPIDPHASDAPRGR